jgi:hypothetical protein
MLKITRIVPLALTIFIASSSTPSLPAAAAAAASVAITTTPPVTPPLAETAAKLQAVIDANPNFKTAASIIADPLLPPGLAALMASYSPDIRTHFFSGTDYVTKPLFKLDERIRAAYEYQPQLFFSPDSSQVAVIGQEKASKPGMYSLRLMDTKAGFCIHYDNNISDDCLKESCGWSFKGTYFSYRPRWQTLTIVNTTTFNTITLPIKIKTSQNFTERGSGEHSSYAWHPSDDSTISLTNLGRESSDKDSIVTIHATYKIDRNTLTPIDGSTPENPIAKGPFIPWIHNKGIICHSDDGAYDTPPSYTFFDPFSRFRPITIKPDIVPPMGAFWSLPRPEQSFSPNNQHLVLVRHNSVDYQSALQFYSTKDNHPLGTFVLNERNPCSHLTWIDDQHVIFETIKPVCKQKEIIILDIYGNRLHLPSISHLEKHDLCTIAVSPPSDSSKNQTINFISWNLTTTEFRPAAMSPHALSALTRLHNNQFHTPSDQAALHKDFDLLAPAVTAPLGAAAAAIAHLAAVPAKKPPTS